MVLAESDSSVIHSSNSQSPMFCCYLKVTGVNSDRFAGYDNILAFFSELIATVVLPILRICSHGNHTAGRLVRTGGKTLRFQPSTRYTASLASCLPPGIQLDSLPGCFVGR